MTPLAQMDAASRSKAPIAAKAAISRFGTLGWRGCNLAPSDVVGSDLIGENAGVQQGRTPRDASRYGSYEAIARAMGRNDLNWD